ncbi:MAG: hypothetical protein ABI603_00370 [Acidobacteriota bacterium]
MTRAFELQAPPELGYRRKALFALELLDPVTLERITDGVEVKADGLAGVPRVNSGGLFVWLDEDASGLQSVAINPMQQPYDAVLLARGDLTLPPSPSPLTTIELPPRVDYPLPPGITAARGTLNEDSGTPATPVTGASIELRWLDDDGVMWHQGRPVSRTNAGGDFLAILRLSPADIPQLDSAGRLTVRLQVTRGSDERRSLEFKLPQGRVADPSTSSVLIAAWNDLQP